MHKAMLVAAGILALSIAVLPQNEIAQSDAVDGQVTKIDEAAGKVTLKHGPIKKFDMDEGMTMVFLARGLDAHGR